MVILVVAAVVVTALFLAVLKRAGVGLGVVERALENLSKWSPPF